MKSITLIILILILFSNSFNRKSEKYANNKKYDEIWDASHFAGKLLLKINTKLISAEKANKMIANGKIKNVIDVRTQQEWDDGHYHKAHHFPIEPENKLHLALDKLNKNDTILVYCRSGRRAKNAAIKLKMMGFKKIYYINETYKSLI